MESSTIAVICIYGLILAFFLAIVFIILFALYLLTEGVAGIARRLYAMLLLFLSTLVAGVVIGVPVLLVAVAIGGSLIAVATAAGIPLSFLGAIALGISRATQGGTGGASSREGRNPRDSGFRSYLEWIKQVAQGKKRPN
jgi:hypothetical protein